MESEKIQSASGLANEISNSGETRKVSPERPLGSGSSLQTNGDKKNASPSNGKSQPGKGGPPKASSVICETAPPLGSAKGVGPFLKMSNRASETSPSSKMEEKSVASPGPADPSRIVGTSPLNALHKINPTSATPEEIGRGLDIVRDFVEKLEAAHVKANTLALRKWSEELDEKPKGETSDKAEGSRFTLDWDRLVPWETLGSIGKKVSELTDYFRSSFKIPGSAVDEIYRESESLDEENGTPSKTIVNQEKP